MHQFIEYVRPLAELLSFASAIIVALIAAYGIQQVRLMKQDIELRSDRAAKEKAIEYSSRYLTRYVELDGKSLSQIRQHKLPLYTGPIGDFTLKSIPPELAELIQRRCELLDWLPAMNELSSISAAFVSGVADEELGFETIGRTYCGTVELNYAVLCHARSDIACMYYENIVALYRIWAPRLSKEELKASRDLLETQIADIPDKHIPPLGGQTLRPPTQAIRPNKRKRR